MTKPTVNDKRPRLRSLNDVFRYYSAQPTVRQIAGMVAVGLVGRAALGKLSHRDLKIVLSVAAYWPLQEWAMHKYLLHLKPRAILGKKFDPFFAQKHREHHQDPEILANILLPEPVVKSGVIGTPLVFALLTRDLKGTLTGTAAFGAAGLLYEWTHLLTHTDYRPQGAFYRRVWRNHRLHHYRSEKYWYAFTVPHVDAAFGTDPNPRDVALSPDVRDLGVRDEGLH